MHACMTMRRDHVGASKKYMWICTCVWILQVDGNSNQLAVVPPAGNFHGSRRAVLFPPISEGSHDWSVCSSSVNRPKLQSGFNQPKHWSGSPNPLFEVTFKSVGESDLPKTHHLVRLISWFRAHFLCGHTLIFVGKICKFVSGLTTRSLRAELKLTMCWGYKYPSIMTFENKFGHGYTPSPQYLGNAPK